MDTLQDVVFNPFDCRLDDVLFLPAVKEAVGYDCMIGYFSSSSFRAIAQSLLYYLQSNIQHRMRFIISPNLSKEDIQVLIELYEGKISTDKLDNYILNLDSLSEKTLNALAYLINLDRIEIKIALPKSGLFHVKCWLLPQSNNSELVVQGSSNHTESGLVRNFEYLSVFSTLSDTPSQRICQKMRQDFDLLWANEYPNVTCGYLSLEVLRALLNHYQVNPSIKQSKKQLVDYLYQALQQQETHLMDSDESSINLEKLLSEYTPNTLMIPDWLDYRAGDYAHQGEAIDAWFDNNKQGILSIATGGGKTLTSLTAATLLSKSLKNLLVVVSVPTKALMNQWEEEVELFGIRAINLNNFNTKSEKIAAVSDTCKRLRFNSSHVGVIITSHEGLKSDIFKKVEKYSQIISTLLIADEVHNLGSVGFQENPPGFFEFKLGLSATPIRQYDEEGTNFLLKYFNGVVYEFGLKQAIGKCLAPFDYIVHRITLTDEESDEFFELTKKIRKLSFAAEAGKDSNEYQNWTKLCIRRRRIIETAENKVLSFKNFILSESEIKNMLIFCSDKQPEQLKDVNEILRQNHINFHQITSKETSNNTVLKRIIDDYNHGKLQVLTSKRVLDEGFNVPQTKYAHILASNTTKKQWTQRLGRILRKFDNKDKAAIHDYIVLPALYGGSLDEDFKQLILSEVERIEFFINYSSNGTEAGGAVSLLGEIGDLLNRTRSL